MTDYYIDTSMRRELTAFRLSLIRLKARIIKKKAVQDERLIIIIPSRPSATADAGDVPGHNYGAKKGAGDEKRRFELQPHEPVMDTNRT
ncbi:hypothetical protein EVAR_48332_1 [Eumeta japonica]|uniref:Uncharacterized protein n=1 Tax=Eumeta variegata TaxID=151549 RepID=A0A4C1YRE0_EUMVA|nr:hypothetical protein EVAR_48332_1 [Eumeta japonica]